MLRSKKLGLFVVGAGAVLLAACGSARLVSRTPYGGVVALEGDRGKAEEDAQRLMAEHCGPGLFRYVQEGEAVVGSDTAHSDETYATNDGALVNQGGSSTRQATEWRIEYECANAPAAAPGAAPPPGGAPGY